MNNNIKKRIFKCNSISNNNNDMKRKIINRAVKILYKNAENEVLLRELKPINVKKYKINKSINRDNDRKSNICEIIKKKELKRNNYNQKRKFISLNNEKNNFNLKKIYGKLKNKALKTCNFKNNIRKNLIFKTNFSNNKNSNCNDNRNSLKFTLPISMEVNNKNFCNFYKKSNFISKENNNNDIINKKLIHYESNKSLSNFDSIKLVEVENNEIIKDSKENIEINYYKKEKWWKVNSINRMNKRVINLDNINLKKLKNKVKDKDKKIIENKKVTYNIKEVRFEKFKNKEKKDNEIILENGIIDDFILSNMKKYIDKKIYSVIKVKEKGRKPRLSLNNIEFKKKSLKSSKFNLKYNKYWINIIDYQLSLRNIFKKNKKEVGYYNFYKIEIEKLPTNNKLDRLEKYYQNLYHSKFEFYNKLEKDLNNQRLCFKINKYNLFN